MKSLPRQLSYLAHDGQTLFSVCEPATPKAIRRPARRNPPLVDRSFQIQVLDSCGGGAS